MKKLLKNNILVIIGLVIGAIAGFLYYKQIGCASGTCTITSSPINSTVYGAIMGSLIFSMFTNKNNNKKISNDI